MILCIVAAGFSPHIGVPQSYIFMRHWVRPSAWGTALIAYFLRRNGRAYKKMPLRGARLEGHGYFLLGMIYSGLVTFSA